MRLKKVIALVLAAAAVVWAVAGCGKSGTETSKAGSSKVSQADSESAPKELTIRWISQGIGEKSWEGETKPILEEFEKETGIHVNAEFYSFNDLFEVIETKAAAKASDFDVMSVDVTYVPKYGLNGYLAPLDQYFTEEEKSQWTKSAYEAGCWDGNMYAAPENTSTQLLWYNKTLLDQAGIQVPQNDPKHRLTYEQVAELAKEAKEKLDPDQSKGIIGFDFQQVSRVYQMNMLPNSMGGKNIGDDGYTVDGIINTQPWIDSMTWYQNLVKEGIASRGYDADQITEYFYNGKMVFMIGGPWTISKMNTGDEIGCTYAPAFKGYEDKVATASGSWYFGVNAASKNQEAAAKFVKFFTLGKGNDMWLDINKDMPCRENKLSEIAAPESKYPDYLKIGAYEAQNTAVARAITPAFGEYSTILNQTWEDVRNGADVKAALEDAVSQINSATAVYK